MLMNAHVSTESINPLQSRRSSGTFCVHQPIPFRTAFGADPVIDLRGFTRLVLEPLFYAGLPGAGYEAIHPELQGVNPKTTQTSTRCPSWPTLLHTHVSTTPSGRR